MKKVLILVFVSLLVLFVGNAFAIETITNGGFEDGLTGWSTQGYVAALGTHEGISPIEEGSLMAVMSYPPHYTTQYVEREYWYFGSNLWQEFSIDPALYTEATISFNYNLWAYDWAQYVDYGADYFSVTYDTTELLRVYFKDPWDGSPTILGWQTFSTTLPASELSGPLTLKFHVENFSTAADPYSSSGDPYHDFIAFIDNVSIDATPIPEPATVCLLGFGSLALLRKRRML